MQITEIRPGVVLASEHLPFVRSVSIGFWVRSGVEYEPDHLQGASHFLEHLLFKGTTKRTSRDISEAFASIGGEVNAFTAKEYTCYYGKVVDQHLEQAVDVLTDMICHARLAESDVDKERKVILEEIGMYEDSPDEYVHDLLAAAIWPNHPLGRAVLGTRETLQAIDAASIRSFYQQLYCPGNIVIAAAGSLEHEQLATWLSARLELPPPSVASIRLPEPEPASFQQVLVNRPTEQLHLTLGFRGLSMRDDRRYAWQLLNNILGGGMSSRLFQQLREEHALVYSTYSYTASFQLAGYSAIYLGLAPQNAGVALELIDKELRDLATNTVAEAELRRAKEQVKGALIMGLESTANHMGRLGRGMLLFNRVQPVEEVIEQIEKVSADDIRNLAQELFLRSPIAVAAVGQTADLPQFF